MIERWKPVINYEGYYEASDQGRIRSLDIAKYGGHGFFYRKKGCILRQGIRRPHGYHIVVLAVKKTHTSHYVHRLILEAFRKKPQWARVCNHLDGNKSNNCLANLRWSTYSENLRHAYMTGLRQPKG